MEAESVYPVLLEVFRRVFKDPGLQIEDSTTSQDVAAWDSLNHLVLISAIESEFKVKFKLKELMGMDSVGDLVKVIASKTAP
jgi:acyl carrier protein